jgi:hypothetical protein
VSAAIRAGEGDMKFICLVYPVENDFSIELQPIKELHP